MEKDKFVNTDAEMEVLGAVFMDNGVMKELIDILKPEDFYNTASGIIFSAMCRLYIAGTPIDTTTVIHELGGSVSEVGGVTYIAQLVSSSISASNVMAHCNIVKYKARRRMLYSALNQCLQDVKNTDAKNDDLIESLENQFKNIETFEAKRDGKLEKTAGKYLELLEERFKNDGVIEGYATGLKLIDKFSGGFQKQDLIILAARPSMGKSAAALNMAANMALDSGLKVAVFQLEMNQLSTFERIIANRAGIPMDRLKKGELQDEEWGEVVNKTNSLSLSQLNIYDDIYSLKEIRSECRRLKLQKGLDVVFVDYLQLIENGSDTESRNENVSKISRGLKLLAKELDITVVALSQLSRAPEARNNHRPHLSDLRDSGSIEQDADMVLFLYRDEYYNADSEDAGLIEFIIAKHRNGETGTIKARWQGKYQRVVA